MADGNGKAITKDAAISRYERLKQAMAKVREETAAQVRDIKGTAETVGMAAGMGFARGRLEREGKEFKMMGVEVDLAAGVALKVAAFAGLGDVYDEDLHHLGNGALASYATVKAHEFGMQARGASKANGNGNGNTTAGRRRRPGAIGAGARARQRHRAAA